jgi:hypothetical protein
VKRIVDRPSARHAVALAHRKPPHGGAPPRSQEEFLLRLQRQAGNQAVQRLIVQRGVGASTVGRAHAVRVLERGGGGTAAAVMLVPVRWLYRVMGNVGSGAIGAHYEQVFDMLNQPVTIRLLMRIAIRETQWWNQQPGFPGYFGSAMTSRQRFAILRRIAQNRGLLPPRR